MDWFEFTDLPQLQSVKLDNDIQYNTGELNKRQQEYQRKNERILQLLQEIEKIKEKIQELDEIWSS